MPKKFSELEVDEILVGLVLVNLVGFSAQDFFILLFYKTLGFITRSTQSALIIFAIFFLGMYVWLFAVPEKTAEEVI